jgi:hypothetical protein
MLLQDLEYDRQLQDVPRLLPTSLNLPAITATEYCVNYVHQLRSVLGQCPPNQPTEMAIDMLVAVAQLQRCELVHAALFNANFRQQAAQFASLIYPWCCTVTTCHSLQVS